MQLIVVVAAVVAQRAVVTVPGLGLLVGPVVVVAAAVDFENSIFEDRKVRLFENFSVVGKRRSSSHEKNAVLVFD